MHGCKTFAAWVICHGTPILPRAALVDMILKVPPYFGSWAAEVVVDGAEDEVEVVVGAVVEESPQPKVPKTRMPINNTVIHANGILFRIVPSNFHYT